MKWAWKMCNCTEIFREKKLTLLESPSRQMCVTTLPWFLPQCTKPGRKRSLGPAVQLLLKQKPVAGAAPFCSKCCSFPGGVPAPHIPGWPQSWRFKVHSFLRRTAVLSTSLLDSVSQSLLFYIQTLCFLFCTAKSCQLNTREFTFPLYKHFFNI